MRHTHRSWIQSAVGLLVVLTAAPVTASSIVFPTGAQAQVQAIANINATVASSPSTETVSSVAGTSTSASVSGATGNATASIDMTAGQLKVDGTSTAGFTSTATGWEFVTFSGSGLVDFSFALDGLLSNTYAGGMVYVEPSVRIYDVTTWSDYFGTTGDLQYTAFNGVGSPFPYMVGSAYGIQGVRGATSGGCTLYAIADCTVNSSGSPVPVDFSLAGSFTAAANQLYLIELQVSTATFNQQLGIVPQVGDFSHTATFDFTNLDGLTFQSSSGEFLAADVPVPEPGTLTLVAFGMLAAGVRRRRSRGRS
jgi:hypothetical protein